MEELELRDLFKILKKRIIAFATIAILVAVLASIVLIKPKSNTSSYDGNDLYKSSASIVINTFSDNINGGDNDLIMVNQHMVKTCGILAGSENIAQKTVDDLKLNITAKELLQKIVIKLENDNLMIYISYVDQNNGEQQKILEKYMDNFIETFNEIYPSVKLSILDKASINEKISVEQCQALISNSTNLSTQLGNISEKSTKNKILLLGLSIFAGILISGVSIVFLEMRKGVIRKKAELGELSSLNTISKINGINDKDVDLEKFREIRNFIKFKSNKMIAIAGSTEGDGRTTISLNIAKSFAESGFKTLLLEADGRNSGINKILNIENCKGISEIITDNDLNNLDGYFCDTENKNLSVLCWGAKECNPSDLMIGFNFNEFNDRLKDKFEYIIVDTPAMARFSESSIICTKCDSTIIVIAEDKTKKNDVERMSEILKINNISPMGLVWINSNR